MSKRKGYKKPNWLAYLVYIICSKFYSKFILNLKVTKNELKGKKGSFLILANHESVIDFMPLAASVPKSHFVISSSFYNTLKVKKVLDAAGVIPKQQFQTAPGDLKKMKEVVDNNMPLAIYPAGLMSEQGITTPIPESTGKFLKWLKQDVYIAKIKGTYLSKPKWSSITRKGKTYLEIYKLLSKEDLVELSNEEIFDIICEELYFDAYKNQEELMIKFRKGNNIVGLDGVLYKCPKCGKEFTIKVDGINKLVCTCCGNSAISCEYGFLHPVSNDDVIFKHPSDWAKKIEDELYQTILNDNEFMLSDSCSIYLLNHKKSEYEFAGSGNITLNRQKIIIDSTINNEPFKKEVRSTQYITLPFVPNKRFEIQDGDVSYRIVLNEKIATTKWVWAIKALYKIENGQ